MVCFLEKFFDHAAKTVAAEENDRIAGFSCAAKEGEQVGILFDVTRLRVCEADNRSEFCTLERGIGFEGAELASAPSSAGLVSPGLVLSLLRRGTATMSASRNAWS